MAIGYARTTSVNRAAGKNAVCGASYIARERIEDERLGLTFDYRKKADESPAIILQIIVPNGEKAPARSELWNMAEKAEVKSNATVARVMIGALPNELDGMAQTRISMAVAKFISEQHQVAVDGAIHRDPGNHHVHFQWTSRRYAGGQLGEKTRELDVKGTASKSLLAIRKFWQDECNRELEAAGFADRIDMRSYDERGIDREGQVHIGKNAYHHHERTGQNAKAIANEKIVLRHRLEDDYKAQMEIRAANTGEALEARDKARKFRRNAQQVKATRKKSPQPEDKHIHRVFYTEAEAKAIQEENQKSLSRVFLSEEESRMERGKKLLGEMADFLVGETSPAEFIEALKEYENKEQPANLLIADSHGNRFVHLAAAVQFSRRLKAKLATEDEEETREIYNAMARVGEAFMASGGRLDYMTQNASGQTPADVRDNGLAKTPPAPKAARNAKTKSGKIVWRRAKSVPPFKQKRPKKQKRNPAGKRKYGIVGNPPQREQTPQNVDQPIQVSGGLSIPQKIAQRGYAAAAAQGQLLPGQWLIPHTATAEEAAIIIAHNKDIANATNSRFSRKLD